MSINRYVTGSLSVLALPITISSCTFPVIEVVGSGGAHGTTTSTTANAATSTVTSTAGNASTTSTTSTTDTSGVSTSESVSSSTGTLQMCAACLLTSTCDCDGDGVERYDAQHGCTNVANDAAHRDCDDCSNIVYPGQTGYFEAAGPDMYDYNCDGAQEPKYLEGMCSANSSLGGCGQTYLELSAACGDPVILDHCVPNGLGPCLAGTPQPLDHNPCH